MSKGISTPDLYDQFADAVQVAEPLFSHYGGRRNFSGVVDTVQCFEDNSKVAEKLRRAGHGKVLVVDGAASLRYALLGDQLAAAAIENGWAGICINGCVRDVELLFEMQIGVMALAAVPRKTLKADRGEIDITLRFAGLCCSPGMHLYADENGILLAGTSLLD